MLDLHEFMPVNYLKKEAYTGSHRGMRYRMWKGESGEDTVLMAAAWPGALRLRGHAGGAEMRGAV